MKAVFAQPAAARALLQAALPSEIVAELDLGALRVVSANVLTAGLREKFADLLFECRARSEPVLLHVLLEHKSGSFRFTVLDLVVSAGAIWDDWRRRNPSATQVPRILPVVFHHGRDAWSAPLDLPPLFFGDLGDTPLGALDPRPTSTRSPA